MPVSRGGIFVTYRKLSRLFAAATAAVMVLNAPVSARAEEKSEAPYTVVFAYQKNPGALGSVAPLFISAMACTSS